MSPRALIALVLVGCAGPASVAPVDAARVDVVRDASADVRRRDVVDTGVDALQPPNGVRAGFRCDTDDDCDSAILVCDVRAQVGFCTTACEDDPDRAAEEAQCGGEGTTCLAQSATPTPARGTCTRACRPTVRTVEAGACIAGQVCTGWWLFRNNVGDAAGCFPWCSDDVHCAPGVRCNGRQGSCGAPQNPEGLPDGHPCDPRNTGPGGRSADCRGLCFLPGASSTDGVCGSLLNVAATPRCPDEPERMAPLYPRGRDNLGLCVFLRCAADAECPAPLRCLMSALAGGLVCTHPG